MQNSATEVIFEYLQIGRTVKVTAVDIETGTETTVITPSTISEQQRKMIALQKLYYVMQKSKEYC